MIERLTLAEKVALCLGSDMWHTTAIPRLGIPAVMVSDGPHGLRRKPDDTDPAGISGSLPATCFPTASALGSSWNPQLILRIGQAIGVEARAQGVAVVLGPGVNIKRNPLCGRNFEYFSEDPMLSGVLGAALVNGIQSQGVGACVKHFAANNQETDRVRVSADVDERTLREIYLPAFERIVTDAAPWMVMCAYNKINGVWASENPWLLTEVLRHEWGYTGLVVSDWGAVHDRVAALAAGLDLEMPPNHGVSDTALIAAVRDGSLDEAVVDESAARVLQLADKARHTTESSRVDAGGHHALARAAAAECAVLLKNDHEVLPLRPKAGDLIAVIGEFARTPRFQGAGSSQVNPTRIDVPLDELRKTAPAGVEIAFATIEAGEEAVDLARRATTVVVFAGLPPASESEGFDRLHMNLPANQTTLIAHLAAVNPNLVVVLANGAAAQMSDWDQHARAILETWLSGQAMGGAIADLLYGAVNPSGRLAETIPLRLQDNPSHLNFPGEAGHVRYGEGVFVGYRGYDALDRDVAYPFGHGLSYTTFRYSDLRVDDLTVTCTVTNTGQRGGQEVVQLYVGDPHAQVARPIRELKGFTKISLEPGDSTTVSFPLSTRDLSYWSPAHRLWVLEGGTFEIAVGASSRDLRLITTVDIAAAPLPVQLDGMATLHEWLADPQGEALIRQAIGTGADGQPRGILANDELRSVIGDFPISTLAAFPGTGIDHNMVAELTRQVQPRQPT